MGTGTGFQNSPLMKRIQAGGGSAGGAGMTPKPMGLPTPNPVSAVGSPMSRALPMTPTPGQGFDGGPTMAPPDGGGPMPMTPAPQPNPAMPNPGLPRRQMGGGKSLPFYGAY